MKPVFQTRISPVDGNCFQACLASIFELELGQVPYYDTASWVSDYNAWLLQHYGLIMINLFEGVNIIPPVFCILSGQSPRFACNHAVVGKGLKMVHDPHPSQDGVLGNEKQVWIFLAVDPARFKQFPEGIL